jgi:hypothetical protein
MKTICIFAFKIMNNKVAKISTKKMKWKMAEEQKIGENKNSKKDN